MASQKYEATAENLQEALNKAVEAAENAIPGADILIQWTLVEIKGQKGGIVGFNDTTVVIEVQSDAS